MVGALSLAFLSGAFSTLATTYYASLPPMSQCGATPHAVPNGMQQLVSEIERNPKFIQTENGTGFQFSSSSMMTEQYYNATTQTILHVTFVHLISNKAEYLIVSNIFPNGNISFSKGYSEVACVVVPPAGA